MDSIDIVILWVDGADPEWQRERARYHGLSDTDNSAIRFRDWDLLRFWFRGVECFAPWVHRVHFVTCGHLPGWLDTSNPKLHVVRHSDYIPADALPTFNSNAIELGLNRIEGLSERFIYFNDDMFLLRPMHPTDFFVDGLPCDDAILSPVMPIWDEPISYTAFHNMLIINRHFDCREVIRRDHSKWLSPVYGKQLLRTLMLLPWRHFPGFFNDHLPQPFLRRTFEDVWEKEPVLLAEVQRHRFRDYKGDVNQWLMRYWQFGRGWFIPASPKRGRDLDITAVNTPNAIRDARYGMICLNDRDDIEDFAALKERVHNAFAALLPEVSSFERA